MQQDLITSIQSQLLTEKEDLETQLRHMEKDALGESMQEAISELSSYDNHPADLGSEMFERSKDLSLKQLTQNQVAKINDALDKIEAGSYGKCDNCGKEIEVERLEAMPATTFCIDCKSAEEVLPDRHPRPIEEDVIAPPFGGRTHDSSPRELGDAEDENEFDGEDTWQQLTPFAEHAPDADAGSYYGGMDYDEDKGYVEDVDHLAYEKGEDGMFYALTPDNEIPDNIVEQEELPASEEETYQEQYNPEKEEKYSAEQNEDRN